MAWKCPKCSQLLPPDPEIERLRAELGGMNLANRAALREVDRLHNTLEPEIDKLRAALKRIAGYERGGCLGRDADEMIDIARDTLGTDEQRAYTAANGEELPAGSSGTSIVNDGRPT